MPTKFGRVKPMHQRSLFEDAERELAEAEERGYQERRATRAPLGTDPPPTKQLPLFDPGPAFARGYARARHFTQNPDVQEAMAVIRGALAKTLEESFESGPLREILWNAREGEDERDTEERWHERAVAFVEKVIDLAEDRDRAGIVRAFEKFGLDVYQAIAVSLFPELFVADPRAVGLVPRTGVERCGVDRAKALARLIGDVARSA